MKIAVLTYPLNNNFGNLLQAWALKKYLEKQGCQVEIVDCQKRETQWTIVKNRVKTVIRKTLCMQVYSTKSRKQKRVYSQNTVKFITENIGVTHYYTTSALNRKLADFYAVIVGSDQVWRPSFLPRTYKNYFLYKLNPSKAVKRIAYAASLGVDCWEFTPQQEKIAREWLSRFDAISVREYSAVKLLREHLSIDSCFMIDPTFLIDKSNYLELLGDESVYKPLKGELFCYALDLISSDKVYVDKLALREGLTVSYIEDFYDIQDNLPVYPSVGQWLYNMFHAGFIITNSFHGCALSLIFNIPFIAVFNEKRGNARLLSLLSIFKLERHICYWDELENITLDRFQVDWNFVNSKIEEYKKMTDQFICSSLR